MSLALLITAMINACVHINRLNKRVGHLISLREQLNNARSMEDINQAIIDFKQKEPDYARKIFGLAYPEIFND